MNALEIYQQYNQNQPKNKSNVEKAFDGTIDTFTDLMSQVLVGTSSSLEGVYDTGLTGLAWASGLISKKAKESITKEIKKNYTSIIDEHLKQYYEDSYLYDMGYAGDLIRQTGQGVGQMLPALGVASLSSALGATPHISRALSQATFFAGATGRGVQDSLNEGATFGQATAYGVMSGSVELATERIFTGSTGNIFGRGMVNGTLARVSSSTLWRLAKEAAGEAFEEALAEFVNPLLKRATYDKNAGFMTEEHKQAILQSAIVGGLTSIAYGQTFGRIRTAQSKDLEDVGELHDLQKKQNVLASRGKSDVKFDELVMKKKDATSKKLIEMEAKERAEYIKKNQLGNYFNEDGTVISNQENTESMTAQARNSKIPDVKVATEINDDQKKTIDLATKMNQKVVIADIDPISNGRGRKKTIVNGYYDVDTQTIVINKNAKNSAQTVFVHELTHKLEGTKEYAKLGEFIMKKANSNKVLNQMMLEMGITQENIEQMYKKQTKDLSEKQADYVVATEFMARATSEVLFTDEASIQEIANTDRSLATKIYDYIKTTLEKMTKKVTFDDWETKGMSKEDIKNASNEMRVFLNTIKTAEQLYRKALENERGGVKISDIKEDGIKRYSVEDLRKESIRKALAGELGNGETVHLGFTPELLVKLGFKQQPMSITIKHLKESTDGTKHNIPLEYYESMFNGSLNDPTFIIQKNDIFIFGTNDMVDGGNPVIIPIKKDATNAKINGVIVDVNMVLSVYGKEKLAKYLDSNIKNIIYWNKQKASELNTAARLQLSRALNSLANNTSINDNKSNVNNRFSITQDSKGNKLSKEQQEYFKNTKALDDNGNLKVLYHGTINYGKETTNYDNEGNYVGDEKHDKDTFGFEYFNKRREERPYGFLTDSKQSAISYAHGNEKAVYEGYVKIENPFVIDAKDSQWSHIFFENIDSSNDKNYSNIITELKTRAKKSISTDDINNVVLNYKVDGKFFYDGVIIKNIKDDASTSDNTPSSNVYVTYNEGNFKTIDNKKPTDDRRFRYSFELDGQDIQTNVTESKNLVALHNLSIRSLKRIIELGGFPVPSIAITKAEHPFDEFGDVTVVFGRETIDPANSKNKVYTRDIYSKTMPKEYQNLTKLGEKRFAELKTLGEELDYELNDNAFEGKTPSVAVSDIKHHPSAKLKYIKEKNIPFKMLTKKTDVDGYSLEEVQAFIAKHPNINSMMSYDELYALKDEIVAMELKKNLSYNIKKPLPESVIKNLEESLRETIGFGFIDRLVTNFARANKKGLKETEYDRYGTLKAIDNLVETNDKTYNEWLENYVEEMYDGQSVYKGENDEYIRNDLSALTHYMQNGKTVGSQKNLVYGLKDAIAHANKQITTFSQLKKYSEELVDTATQRQLKEALEQFDEETRSVVTAARMKLVNGSGFSFFSVFEDYYKAIADVLSKRRSVAAALRYRGFDAKYESELKTLIDLIKQYPSDYFEAKPQRAVELSEIKKVLLPENTDKKTLELLNEKQIPYEIYDGKDGSRSKILQSMDGIRLSLDSEGNELTSKQIEYFEKSRVRNDDGKLIVVYHGSDKFGFDTFKDSKNDDAMVAFFTDQKEVAKTYAKSEKKIYEGYLKIENPFIVDAEGSTWKSIRNAMGKEYSGGGVWDETQHTWVYKNDRRWIEGNPDASWENEYFSTNDIVNNVILLKKYDGIIIKNVIDAGKYTKDAKDWKKMGDNYTSTIYVILKSSSQFKSKENKNPTSVDNMRYMLVGEKSEAIGIPKVVYDVTLNKVKKALLKIDPMLRDIAVELEINANEPAWKKTKAWENVEKMIVGRYPDREIMYAYQAFEEEFGIDLNSLYDLIDIVDYNANIKRKYIQTAGMESILLRLGFISEADLETKLATAKRMHKTQVAQKTLNVDQIVKETGWLLSKDGKWKYRIDTSDTTFDIKKFIDRMEYFDNSDVSTIDRYLNLEDILKSDNLYKHYPHLRDIKVYAVSNTNAYKGYWDGRRIVMNRDTIHSENINNYTKNIINFNKLQYHYEQMIEYVQNGGDFNSPKHQNPEINYKLKLIMKFNDFKTANEVISALIESIKQFKDGIAWNQKQIDRLSNYEDFKTTLIHEVQHAIQSYEDWANGGNLEIGFKLIETKLRNDAYIAAEQQGIKSPYDVESFVMSYMVKKKDQYAYEAYRNILGERESQLAELNIYNKEPLPGEPDYEKTAYAIDEYNNLIDDTRMQGNIRYSLETSTDENIAKRASGKVNDKVYSKADAEKIINDILNEIMVWENYQGTIDGKTKNEVIKALWLALNSKPEGERAKSAIEIAEYLMENALLEDYYNDVDDKMNFEFITATKKYLGRINLDTIKDDVKYTFGKNTNAFLLWGKRKGKPAVDISVVKDELEAMGIFLDGNTDADVFIDLFNKYKKAHTTIKQEMKKLKSELTKDELTDFKNSVVREVLNAWDKTGKPTQLAQQMTKLQDVIKDLRSQLNKTKRYTYAVSRLIDTVRRVEALEKYRSVEEIPLSKEIVGMIKLLAKVKTWRGNISNSESIRQIFKKYSTAVMTDDGRLIPLYNLYHQQNNNQTFGENNPYADMINWLANGKGELSAEDIDMIDKILTNFAHNVRSYDKVFFQGKEQSESELATRAIEETKKTIPLKQSGLSEKVGRYSRWITSPIWRFDRLSNYNKDGYFAQVYRELHKGVSKQAKFKQMVAKHFEAFFKEHRKTVDGWHDETITFGDIKISKGQAISLYLSYQREQAKPHMFNVGTDEGIIRFANEKKAQEHKTQDSVTYGKDTRITESMILELYSKMNMVDKQFIELTKTFFNKIAKDAKVETDVALFGVSNVSDEKYFPIRVSDDVIYHQIGSSDFEFAALFSVYNASFNKNVRKNANNKMVIENVLDIIERHTQQMSAYYGLAIPIKSFNRIWNKKIGNTRLNNEITKVDPDFKKYVNKLLKDIQGAKADLSTFDRILGKVRGWWARAALGLNPKVLATQFASLLAAGGVGVEYRNLVKGFAKASIGQTDYEKLYEYSPMLYDRAREGNNFDVGLLKQYKGVLGKLDIITNATTAPISKVDSLIVGAVWNAALEQTKSDQYKDYSPEHYEAAAELTEEAVMRTQANWSPLYRPAILRENSSALQMVTMFMSEPLQVFSQIAGSLDRVKVAKVLLKNAKAQGVPSEIKKAEKALEEAKASSRHYAMSITVNALFLSMVGMAFKWIKFGDDDEEKWWQVMLDELQGHFIGMLPVFRDMYSLSQGYDVSNMYQSGLQNLYDGYETIKNTFDRLFDSKEPYDKKDLMKDMRSLLIGLTQTLGIPLRNVETYTKGIIEKFDESMVYKYEDKFFNQTYAKDLEKALEKGDEKLADTIVDLMMDDKHAGIKETRVRNEINRLYQMGYSVMPKAASKTIEVDGEIIELNQRQYKKFQEIYSEADGVVLKMVNSINYARLSDEAKAKAIKIVFDYYHARAKEELTGESFTGNFGIVAEGVDPNILAVITAYARTTTGSTRKAMIMSMMRMQGLNGNQMNLVLAYLGYAADESKIKVYGNTLSLASDQYQQLLKMAGVK